MMLDTTKTTSLQEAVTASTSFSVSCQTSLIIFCAVVAILFGIYNVVKIMSIPIEKTSGPGYNDLEMESINNDEGKTESESGKMLSNMVEISGLIQEGASTFLRQEYLFTFLFVCAFAVVIFLTVDGGHFYTTIAFLLGAFTSILSGYIGMYIAVRTNVRTAKCALVSMNDAFIIAFRGGMVLGFMLVGLALLVLVILILIYKGMYFDKAIDSYTQAEQAEMFLKMFEAIAGYGLGGSTVALFGRVGGGIYTKAADVGADLVGKVIEDMDEDSIQNPGVIADNVGDNVGDIAGMGSDLFGSFAESTCACLVISATSP